jgi:hypothetical protein
MLRGKLSVGEWLSYTLTQLAAGAAGSLVAVAIGAAACTYLLGLLFGATLG